MKDMREIIMIRRACVKDIEAILRLLVQVNMVHHEGRPDLFNGPATKYTSEELEELLKDDSRPVFVYEDGNGVEGYCFCIHQQHLNDNILTDIKTLYIDDLCVDENVRGKHIGSALLDHVTGYAREQGCYNITLNVWELNQGAKQFYLNHGLGVQKTGFEMIL